MNLSQIVVHPKTFLTNNSIWASMSLAEAAMGSPSTFVGRDTAREGAHVTMVNVRPTRRATCTRKGTPMACWEVNHCPSLAGELAYYLPWTPNSTQSMVLGDKADFFITDTMTGCTFAYGPGGMPRVAHSNYVVENAEGVRPIGGTLDQAAIDSDLSRVLPSAHTHALRKADYQTKTFPNVTVIGARRNGRWRFYYQKRDNLGVGTNKIEAFALRSVHRIT